MAAVRSLGGGRGRAGAGPTTHRPPHRPLRPAALPARAPARAGRGRAVAEGREAAAVAEAAGAVETVAVGLGARSYPIYIGAGLLAAERPVLRRHLAGKQVRRAASPGPRAEAEAERRGLRLAATSLPAASSSAPPAARRPGPDGRRADPGAHSTRPPGRCSW